MNGSLLVESDSVGASGKKLTLEEWEKDSYSATTQKTFIGHIN